jgi:hypothetical protein
MTRIATFAIDTVTLAGLVFIALFIFALYQEPQLINAVYCELNTETDLGYTACRIANY